MLVDVDDIKSEGLMCFMNVMIKGTWEQAKSVIDYDLIPIVSILLESDRLRILMRTLDVVDWILVTGDTIKNEEEYKYNPYLTELESE
mmetsp:Transcript_20120/g.17237  ORF Transcript_20120/g.17237 Transcript_20120/m.17237 type:complete len:88 (-) Transcript_20120:191-454(-)